MNILALDLSLVSSGWARLRGGVREVGTIPTDKLDTKPRKLTGMVRLDHIRRRVLELVQGADLAVIESYAFSAGTSHAHEKGELGGVVRLSLWLQQIPYVDFNPSTLKRYATGGGGAKKSGMMAAAVRRLGYNGEQEDEVDALWLLHAALDHYGAGAWAKLPQAQRDALGKVEWPVLAGRGS